MISKSDLKGKEAPIIIREVPKSGLPPEEEYNIVGSETSPWMLGNITYHHLLTKPEMLKRLKEEWESLGRKLVPVS